MFTTEIYLGLFQCSINIKKLLIQSSPSMIKFVIGLLDCIIFSDSIITNHLKWLSVKIKVMKT